jgi:nucleoside-diphosphate-sugar epimerase
MASQRVLLTGVNGFIGTHVLASLLSHGVSVRGVVRTATKASQVKADFPSVPSSQLELFVVPDMTVAGAFDEAVKSNPPFSAVIHTASPFNYAAAKTNNDFVGPAVGGTTGILESVLKYAPEVQRVVITSSFAAIGNPKDLQGNGKVYSSADWDPVTEDDLQAEDLRIAYWASKTFAERGAWDFVKEKTPNFELVVLNPPMVYGPVRNTVRSIQELGTSNNLVYTQFLAGTSKSSAIPREAVHIDVDVRDLAEGHYVAAFAPGVGNSRYLFTRGRISNQEIADILRKNLPEAEERIPLGTPGTVSLPPNAFDADNGPAKKVLGIKFRSHDETFRDLGKQLLELEKGKAVGGEREAHL